MSQDYIVLPLDLRLDLSLTYFEMSYKNIPQKFCGKIFHIKIIYQQLKDTSPLIQPS